MFCPRHGSSNKGDMGSVAANESRQWTKSTISMVAAIVMIVVVLFSLSGCGGSSAESSSSGSSSSSSPEPAPAKTVDDYTWEELSEISAEISNEATEEGAIEVAKKYNLVNLDGKLDGSQSKTVQLSDGTTAEVQIAGFLHDDKTGGGKAGITFIFKDAIAEHGMNSIDTNCGGWEESQMRSWLAADGLAMLPQDLSSRIVAVDKKTNNLGSDTVDKLINDGRNDTPLFYVTTTSDRLWLFSSTELCGAISWYTHNDYNVVLNAEGSEYKLFRDCNVDQDSSNGILTKSYNGSSSYWWQRSQDPDTPIDFNDVHSDGDPSYYWEASHSLGVVPGFCI